ncbi:hypothetical protein PGC34_20125 [Pseudomonas kribbensis]|uniref:hypothetical protein n=1 Tax=Pseudomonas kribbensis TaxID=1628086 RepID=UPI003BF7B313
MPKLIDYPRASLKNSLVLADAVNDLGGECSVALAGDKLNKQATSGAFKALIGAAVKYSLVTNKQGQIKVTQLFRDIKLAYDEIETKSALKKAFLSPVLFKQICDRFEGKALPVAHFEKLLIREFGVPDLFASRLGGYFLEGAKQCGLLLEGNIIVQDSNGADQVIEAEKVETDPQVESHAIDSAPNAYESQEARPMSSAFRSENSDHHRTHELDQEGKFTIRIKGPGMDTLIVINEEDDLLIVRAMLKKVEKRLAVESDWEE